MKLTRIRKVGRYIKPDTNTAVNVYKGRRVPEGYDVYFWNYRNVRMIVGDAHFRTWKEEPPRVPAKATNA